MAAAEINFFANAAATKYQPDTDDIADTKPFVHLPPVLHFVHTRHIAPSNPPLEPFDQMQNVQIVQILVNNIR